MKTDPRFPIGKFNKQASYSAAERTANLEVIRQTPAHLKAALEGLSDSQLETPYREGGWTLRQVAHHIPDSHMNAYIRCKLALTENNPTIKPYDQEAWALLSDTKSVPLEVSVQLLSMLHLRWVALFESFTEADWQRTYNHPVGGLTTLEQMLALYAWHGAHHVAHITTLRQNKGW
ncbi:MAG: YfiT family bacillithiol transferase [Deinococcales bacterium]